ncbi:MAG: phosphoribosylglycinamide formyltransferase [Candidatus Omnitrophota bacterium]|jgi:phosphoribosylglycinamide formyltransferase-1
MKRLAFFVSGNGTNAQNLIRKILLGEILAEAALVISDNPGAGALEKARELGVEARVIDRKKYILKANFEADIIWHLEEKKIDLIILAGFMRILSGDFVARYHGRIINIHPAYLPHFPGAHAIQDAFEAKVTETGVTVHYVDAGVDTGPVILQRKVPVLPGDTLETLEARIHAVEYELYPEALKKVLTAR